VGIAHHFDPTLAVLGICVAFVMFDLAGRLFIGRQCLPYLATGWRFRREKSFFYVMFSVNHDESLP